MNATGVDAAGVEAAGVNAAGVDAASIDAARDLVSFIRQSPSMFHTVREVHRRLDAAGFKCLPESAAWRILRGGSYYTVRNNSSIVAWRVGERLAAAKEAAGTGAAAKSAAPSLAAEAAPYHFQLAAAHADSPTFKVKAVPELDGPGESLRLDVEAYGGMIDYTWFDRPLGLAGRALVRSADGGRIESRLVFIDRPVALIPSLAIHMNREVNKGFAPNRQVDLCPLFSAGALKRGSLDALVARAAGVEPDQLLARDLFLVNLQQPELWGADPACPEFISSPKLDDLMCAHAALSAFLSTANPCDISVLCIFDNEEVGSNTKQGAMSTFLRDALERINAGLGFLPEDLRRALAASMLVSCDNAHAVHPNHPEVADEANRPVLGGGIVIKEAANQLYCTDAFSRAAFAAVCERAGVPFQTFANRSDMRGGSTLGNLSNIQVSMHAVDVGCAQLAMHSSFETAAVADVGLAIRALTAFYGTDLRITGADEIALG